MPYRNNYWKSIIGERAQVLMSLGVAYTSQATYELFVANSVEGELGVFNNDTHALVSGGGAASTTINLFIAVNRGGFKGVFSNAPQVPAVIEKSPIFQIAQASAPFGSMFRQVYDAPVAQVSQMRYLSHASVVMQDVTFVSKAAGASSPITIVYVVAGASTAFSVSVTSNAITVNMATSAGSASVTTADQVAAGIAASGPASALVTATVTGTHSAVQLAIGSTALTGGTAASTVTAGSIYGIRILETTPGFQPYPTYDYQYQAIAGDTEDTIGTKLATMITSTTSVQNRDRDIIVSAAYGNGVLTITSLYFGASFNLLLPGLQFPSLNTDNTLGNIAVVATTTTTHAGSGSADQARLFMQAGDIAKGVTTNYPEAGTTPADFGQPDDFVTLNTVKNFNIYCFSIVKTENSKSYLHKSFWTQNLFLLVPTSGTTPEAQVKAIFGL